MIEFLTGWAAFALVLGIILCGLYLVLKIFASFGNRTLNSAFFAVVLLGGPFVGLGYVWYVLVDFLVKTDFDAIKLLVVLMVGGLFTVLWICSELVVLWIWAKAFEK
jgi:hypothetical protein